MNERIRRVMKELGASISQGLKPPPAPQPCGCAHCREHPPKRVDTDISLAAINGAVMVKFGEPFHCTMAIHPDVADQWANLLVKHAMLARQQAGGK